MNNFNFEYVRTYAKEAIAWVKDYVNPAELAHPELRSQITREQLTAANEANSASIRQDALKAERLSLESKLSQIQDFYVTAALPVMRTYDQESLKKSLCDEVKNNFEKQEDTVQLILHKELKNYGYKSRFLHTLDVTLSALRAKVDIGEPFDVELQALTYALAELGEETAETLTKPLRGLSRQGVLTRKDLSQSLVTVIPPVGPYDAPTVAQTAIEVASGMPVPTAPTDASWVHYLMRRTRDNVLVPHFHPSDRGARKEGQPLPLPEASTKAVELVLSGKAAEAVRVLRASAGDLGKTPHGGLAFERWCRQAGEHAQVQALIDITEARVRVERYSMVHFLLQTALPPAPVGS